MTTGAEWADQARQMFDALRGALPEGAASALRGERRDGHAADCTWCPVCQVAAVVRGERPEVTAALADVLAATATALRTFAATAAPEPSTAEASPPEGDGHAEPPSAVQRIEIA